MIPLGDAVYVLTLVCIVLGAQLVWDWWQRRTRAPGYDDATRPFWTSEGERGLDGSSRSASGVRRSLPEIPRADGNQTRISLSPPPDAPPRSRS